MFSVEHAIEQLIEHARRLKCPESEVCSLPDLHGRVLAEDVSAPINVPGFDNSAMDGYAVNAKDFSEQLSVDGAWHKTVSQRIPAGIKAERLQEGSIARIFTGAMMPEGADAVVIQENTQVLDDGRVAILKMPEAADNVRPTGDDIQKGARLIEAGTKLDARHIALLASVGIAQVNVFKPLKVAIFSTGDELVDPGEPLSAGQIYNSNCYFLIALCKQLGFEPIDCGRVEDTLPATQQALQDAAKNADVVISSGGVSVGEEDHVRPAVQALGTLDFWKVQMKPGKPLAFGYIEKDVSEPVPFIGLPGNPVSSYVTFQIIAKPFLQALQQETVKQAKPFTVIAGFSKGTVQRQEYIRVQLIQEPGGLSSEIVAKPFRTQSSGVLSSVCWADGVVIHKVDCEIKEGEPIEFLPIFEGQIS